jgi:AcrR family transcriptional regulator
MGRNREKDLVQIEQTKTRLLEAGRAVILQKGLQQARVRDIVRSADVGIGTFYFHFKDLEQFQSEVNRQTIDDLRQQVRDIRGFSNRSGIQNPEITLRKSFSTFFNSIDENPQAALILLRERTGAGSFAKLARRQFELYTADLKEDLENLAQHDVITKEVSHGVAAEAILGMTLQLAESYAERRVEDANASKSAAAKRSRNTAQDRERIISTLVQMTLHGLSARPANNRKRQS